MRRILLPVPREDVAVRVEELAHAFGHVLPPEAHETGAVAPCLAAEAVARIVQPLAVVHRAAAEAEAAHALQTHRLRLKATFKPLHPLGP